MNGRMIFAIDPGPGISAWVEYRPELRLLVNFGYEDNRAVLDWIEIYTKADAILVVEMVACYGMSVGASIFETCVWIGRYLQEADNWQQKTERVYRREVKMHLCNSMRAKDKNIRQALIDTFPATGGGKIPQIGTKKFPGPLYGVSGDIWSALAVAVTFAETKMGGEEDDS